MIIEDFLLNKDVINKLLRYLRKIFEPFEGDMKNFMLTFFAFFYSQPAFTGQQWKHQNNKWNLLKIHYIDTRRTSRHRSGVYMVNFKQIL